MCLRNCSLGEHVHQRNRCYHATLSHLRNYATVHIGNYLPLPIIWLGNHPQQNYLLPNYPLRDLIPPGGICCTDLCTNVKATLTPGPPIPPGGMLCTDLCTCQPGLAYRQGVVDTYPGPTDQGCICMRLGGRNPVTILGPTRYRSVTAKRFSELP